MTQGGNPISYLQIESPRLDIKVDPGWCLKFVQDSFRAPVMHPSATVAANATKYRFPSRKMPDVAVPVWFDHWGTYQGKYANWGHVVVWVPGRGFLSSPVSGFGQLWLSTLDAVEKTFNSKYRFWSLDINTLQVAESTPTPTKGGPFMKYITLYRGLNSAGSTEKTKPIKGTQSIPGGVRTHLKWNDSETYCFEGARDIGVATASVSVTGAPGTTLSLGAIVGKWVNSKWTEVRWLESVTGVIARDGSLKSQITISNKLAKGERVYFYLHPQKNITPLTVNWYSVKGFGS